MDKLEPLTYPFSGVQAIEASAGTGKTWTIEALYLRLLLGHGCEPRNPREILVVTFTNAATEELQNRIRARIDAAIRVFRGDATDDRFLAGLRDAIDVTGHERCARTLELALQWMDDAAIFTIHGWCHKLLQRFPLASDSLGTFEVSDDDEPLHEVARDYWRQEVIGLSGEALEVFAGLYATPEKLIDPLRKRLPADLASPAEPLAACIGRIPEDLAAELARLKRVLAVAADEFAQLVEEARGAGRIGQRKLARGNLTRWLDALKAWCDDPAEHTTTPIANTLKNLTAAKVTGAWVEGEPPTDHALVTGLAELAALSEWIEQARVTVIIEHAAAWCAPRLEAMKRRRGLATSDDLVARVVRALGGEHGQQFAARIRAYYPVALIDEFQDTDRDQWRIFENVWAGAEGTSLTLIGDPKQSIYSFRGADVDAYLDARDTAAKTWVLDTNYRSSENMVEAVNRVFKHADAHPGGAFLADGRIHFKKMSAFGRVERFVMAGEPAPALTIWHDAVERNGEACRTDLARACATRIYALLDDDRAGFEEPLGFTRVRAPDIAVLVRNRHEAGAVRAALARHHIPSVYLSEGDSVYETLEASQVQRLLQACAWPRDERLVRTACALPLLGRPLDELGALRDDETALERVMQQFLDYHEMWNTRGVLSVLYRVAHDFGLLESGTGARELTNYLHLADLLQNEAALVDGEAALLRVLAERIDSARGAKAGEEQVLRLESDEAVVRVVTVFKSKGLEYPLVFLPFATAPPPKANTLTGAQLAESQRMLYVALTRARHAVWAGAVPTTYYSHNLTHTGLLGHVLGGGAPIGPDELGARLEALWGESGAIVLAPLPDPIHGTLTAPAAHRPKPARQYQGVPRESWWVGSYSALELGPRRYRPVESALEKQLDEADDEAPGASSADAPIHRVARGADTGNFLHKLLEWAAATGFAQAAADADARRREIARRIRHRFEPDEWAPVFDRWLKAILTTRLPHEGTGFALSELTNYRSELEFWYATRRVDARRLDDLVTHAILPGEPRPGVEPGMLNGMLKGYIDLVFEHDGRYFVADFKSNALGDDDDAYTREAMAAQLLKKRYDLQLALYTLALHRLLKTRIGAEYDYDTHVGGALYLYLRGIHEPRQHGVFAVKPPRGLVESLDRLFDGEEINDVA